MPVFRVLHQKYARVDFWCFTPEICLLSVFLQNDTRLIFDAKHSKRLIFIVQPEPDRDLFHY